MSHPPINLMIVYLFDLQAIIRFQPSHNVPYLKMNNQYKRH